MGVVVQQKQKRKIIGRFMGMMLLLIIIGGFFVLNQFSAMTSSKGEYEDNTICIVNDGATTEEIANQLKQANVIKSPLVFRLLTKIDGKEGQLKAGTYQFPAGLTLEQILQKVYEGNTAYVWITIPEGFKTKQIVELLDTKGLIDKEQFMQEVQEGQFNYSFLKERAPSEKRLEGFLFPDTYQVADGMSEHAIIKMMLQRFEDVFIKEWDQRSDEVELSFDEAVILASIIEREAAVDEERPIIASVFYNRLQKNWRLQSCATVQYLFDKPKPRLLNKDTEIESPYNTYLHQGLPPGPISNPGEASLKAVLSPADTDYMFFVAQADGTHHFSKKYSEHLNNK